MNLIEHNKEEYLRHARSPRRVMLIVLSVAVAHVVVISAAARWRGWMPKQGEGLIRVAIFPDKPGPAHAPATLGEAGLVKTP